MSRVATSSHSGVRIEQISNSGGVRIEGRTIDQVWNFLSQFRNSQAATNTTPTTATATTNTPGRRVGHKMSPAARRKLSQAMKARYAASQKRTPKTMAAGG
jgi:hypothetical protein